jgi:hypothetical protein
MTSERLKEAVALARQGEKDQARHILAEIIRDDIHNEMAWLWYADTMPTADAKVQALRECLYHNPNSEPARRGLERLGAKVGTAPLPELEEPAREPEGRPEPEPQPGPMMPPEPETERVPLIPEAQVAGQEPEPAAAPPARTSSPGLQAAGYLIAALVGAIVLGYVGLLVAGLPVVSLADFRDALADTTGLIAVIVGLVVGATVGILILRAILTRPSAGH